MFFLSNAHTSGTRVCSLTSRAGSSTILAVPLPGHHNDASKHPPLSKIACGLRCHEMMEHWLQRQGFHRSLFTVSGDTSVSQDQAMCCTSQWALVIKVWLLCTCSSSTRSLRCRVSRSLRVSQKKKKRSGCTVQRQAQASLLVEHACAR